MERLSKGGPGSWAWLVAGAVIALLFPGLMIPIVSVCFVLWVMDVSRLRIDPASGTPFRGPLLALLMVFCAWFFLISRGTGEIFGRELLGFAFDSLADHLLRGSAEVAGEAIRWEAFVVDGRTHMYFGLWPALIRMPLHGIEPTLSGSWARASCYFAGVFALAAFGNVMVRNLARNSILDESMKTLLLLVSLLGCGLATPLLYLMHAGSIYHESMLWGICGSLVGIAIVFALLDEDEASSLRLLALSSVAGATLLARVTHGGPLYLILAIFAGRELLRARTLDPADRNGRILGTLALLLPAVFALAIQFWYNADRFGSIFTFVDYEKIAFVAQDAASIAVLRDTGSFHLLRLPVALWNYFGIGGGFISGAFPWFRIAAPTYLGSDLYAPVFQSFLIPLSLASPWIVIGAGFGLCTLFRTPGRALARCCALAFGLEFLLISSYFIMEQRYTVDLIPILVFAYAFFLRDFALRASLHKNTKEVAALLAFLVAISCVVTVSSTLSAIPLTGPALPGSYKAQWQERFDAVNAALLR